MGSAMNPNRPPTVELSSPRLLLRGAREEDAVHLYKAFSDPEVMKYWSTLPHPDVATTEAWVKGMMQAPCNGVTDFIVCLKPDLVPIGKMGVWRDREIGFLLSRSSWGKGLATEGLGLILDYLFCFSSPPSSPTLALSSSSAPSSGTTTEAPQRQRPPLDELIADADPRNSACIHLLQKVGFEVYDFKERTFQLGEAWVDSTYLRLVRGVWDRVRDSRSVCEQIDGEPGESGGAEVVRQPR